jgi:hypothetical protein
MKGALSGLLGLFITGIMKYKLVTVSDIESHQSTWLCGIHGEVNVWPYVNQASL